MPMPRNIITPEKTNFTFFTTEFEDKNIIIENFDQIEN